MAIFYKKLERRSIVIKNRKRRKNVDFLKYFFKIFVK